jgi:hypothetical protein
MASAGPKRFKRPLSGDERVSALGLSYRASLTLRRLANHGYISRDGTGLTTSLVISAAMGTFHCVFLYIWH